MTGRANLKIIWLVMVVFLFGTALPAHAGSIIGWGSHVVDSAELAKKNYIAISAGGIHSLALKSDGSIVGWGYNSDGQCNITFT